MPDHQTIPKHWQHVCALVTSSISGSPGADRSCVPAARCARARAIASAWASEQPDGTTTLTPADTSRPVAHSNTAAPNGPPVSRATFSRARRIASRMRAARAAKTSPGRTISSIQAGRPSDRVGKWRRMRRVLVSGSTQGGLLRDVRGRWRSSTVGTGSGSPRLGSPSDSTDSPATRRS